MQTITAADLKAKIDSGETVHLLDVRENDERAEFNIGGHHIPLAQVQAFQLDDIEDWKEEPVYVYCRSGKRSAMASMFLQQAGFTQPVNVEGGVLAWKALG
jgi:rhodanese-related sulfurtransferase